MKQLALVSLVESIPGPMQGPLNLVYLGIWVQSKLPDWRVTIVDAHWENPVETLLHWPFDAIGISSMTVTWPAARELARHLKDYGCKTPILIGGVHVTSCPESFAGEFDIPFFGESELSLVEYLETGTVNRDCPPVDLSQYPDLDWKLLTRGYHRPQWSRFWRDKVSEGTLVTARGCPFRCRFCSPAILSKKCKLYPANWVVRQIAALAERGATHLLLVDELFAVRIHRLQEIATGFEGAGLRNRIKAIVVNARADVLTPEVCDLLRSMNVSRVMFGWESGCDRVLHYLKKGSSSVAANNRSIKLCRQSGLRPVGSVMLGSPTETLPEMIQTSLWALQAWLLGADDIVFYPSIPFPGTEFWAIAKSRGKVSSNMDFARLAIHTKIIGDAMLIDIPRWQFALLFAFANLCLLPFKIKKLAQCLFAWLCRPQT